MDVQYVHHYGTILFKKFPLLAAPKGKIAKLLKPINKNKWVWIDEIIEYNIKPNAIKRYTYFWTAAETMPYKYAPNKT